MTILRERAREVLATHEIDPNRLVCRWCDRTYRMILQGEIECDKAPPVGKQGPIAYRRPAEPRASLRGYEDPKRPHFAWLRAVCEPELRTMLVSRAVKEGITLSEVVRRACRAYVGMEE